MSWRDLLRSPLLSDSESDEYVPSDSDGLGAQLDDVDALEVRRLLSTRGARDGGTSVMDAITLANATSTLVPEFLDSPSFLDHSHDESPVFAAMPDGAQAGSIAFRTRARRAPAAAAQCAPFLAGSSAAPAAAVPIPAAAAAVMEGAAEGGGGDDNGEDEEDDADDEEEDEQLASYRRFIQGLQSGKAAHDDPEEEDDEEYVPEDDAAVRCVALRRGDAPLVAMRV